MKITAFVGSPNQNGNSTALAQAMCDAAARHGHETRLIHLYKMKIAGCMDCGACKTSSDKCVIADDFQSCWQELITSDGIILASPVYFGQVTGVLKTFLDRWCCFFSPGFAVRQLSGKKFATVTTCGAPAERFRSVTDYLNYWMSDFFKMKLVGNVMGGDLVKHSQATQRSELLEAAAKIGASF